MLKKIAVVIFLLFILELFLGCIDSNLDIEKNIVGVWENNNGDKWTFTSEGKLIMSQFDYDIDYWVDNQSYLWSKFVGDELELKYSVKFDNKDRVIIQHLGIREFGIFYKDDETIPLSFTRIN